MEHKQIQPPQNLKEYIRYFWVLESSCVSGLTKTFGPLPDGCPGIIFQQSENVRFHDQNNYQLPGLFLYGQTTRPIKLYSRGTFSVIGICFYPNALKSIFGLNAPELTDSCVDVDILSQKQGFRLSEQLLNASSIDEHIEIFSSYLFSQIRKNITQAGEGMRYALSEIVKSKGNIFLKTLQETLNLSERSFERKFREWVGISPKLFSRICRFQASLSQLRNNHYGKLSDIAYENEYADQSHFIRAFKEFAGFSPYQYQKQSTEIIQNFAELIN